MIKSFTNIVTINFNIFGVFIKYKISSNLNNICVISMKKCRSVLRKTMFVQQTLEPHNFRTCRGQSSILKLYGRFWNMILFFCFSMKLRNFEERHTIQYQNDMYPYVLPNLHSHNLLIIMNYPREKITSPSRTLKITNNSSGSS